MRILLLHSMHVTPGLPKTTVGNGWDPTGH